MALKVNNDPNNQTIGLNYLRSIPLYIGGDSPQQPANANLQPATQVDQFASGNMNKPNNPPPRLRPQHFMGSNGLPMIDFPGPWNYSLNDGAWEAGSHAQLARMAMPAFLPRHINAYHPIYTGGQ